MRRRTIIIIAIVAVLLVTGAAVGVVQAFAQGQPDLASVTPAQLVADVAQHVRDTNAVSGELSWTNDILGLSMLSFGDQGAGDLTSLLMNGSGRLWFQDGKIRFEIQGTAGDTTVVGDSTKVWVYNSADDTATEYTLPARPAAQDTGKTGTTQPATTSVTDPVATINGILQKLAPTADVAVSDSVTVAGRDCYVLSLVPKAANTVFGSVQVAIDGKTYLPLRIQVYAKGGQKPVLSVGFTSVSYDKVADSLFAFTPPSGAAVEQRTLTLPAGLTGKLGAADTSGTSGTSATESATGQEQAELTLTQAAAQAGFTPLSAHTNDPSLAFDGASVIAAQQVDIESLVSKLESSGLGSGLLGSGSDKSGSAEPGPSAAGSAPAATPPSGPVTLGPTVIERYGQGFGTVVLVQAQIPSDLAGWIDQSLGSVPLLSKTTTGGVSVYQFDTALGSAALWDKDGMLFISAGSVSTIDLQGFIASVH